MQQIRIHTQEVEILRLVGESTRESNNSLEVAIICFQHLGQNFMFSLIPSISGVKYDLPSYLSWLGVNREVPITNDFYPLFPWVSFYLFGLWVYQPLREYFADKNKYSLINNYKFSYIYKGLHFFGRNSLTVYILHQPIFFSLFLIFISLSS